MRFASLAILAVVVAVSRPVVAQPGMVPPAYSYAPTPEERDLLASGVIGDGATIAGGLLSIYPGFGIGQAVEGRYREIGYIFTVGELAAYGGAIGSVISLIDCANENCHNDNGALLLLTGSALAYAGLHIWEIVDAFTAPSEHNRRVHALRRRYGYIDYARVTPFVARPHGSDGGGTAGLSFSF
jgi:hypothetical protein